MTSDRAAIERLLVHLQNTTAVQAGLRNRLRHFFRLRECERMLQWDEARTAGAPLAAAIRSQLLSLTLLLVAGSLVALLSGPAALTLGRVLRIAAFTVPVWSVLVWGLGMLQLKANEESYAKLIAEGHSLPDPKRVIPFHGKLPSN